MKNGISKQCEDSKWRELKWNWIEPSWAELCVFIVCVRFTGTLFAFRCFLTYTMLYTFSCDSVTQLFKIIIIFCFVCPSFSISHSPSSTCLCFYCYLCWDIAFNLLIGCLAVFNRIWCFRSCNEWWSNLYLLLLGLFSFFLCHVYIYGSCSWEFFPFQPARVRDTFWHIHVSLFYKMFLFFSQCFQFGTFNVVQCVSQIICVCHSRRIHETHLKHEMNAKRYEDEDLKTECERAPPKFSADIFGIVGEICCNCMCGCVSIHVI